jgi:hypothetical protein
VSDQGGSWEPRQILVATGGGLAVLVVGLLIGLVVGGGGSSGTTKPHHEGEILTVEGPGDSFDRADDPSSLGRSPAGFVWRADAGRWGVVADQAAVTDPAAGRSFAVVPLGGGDGMVQLQLARVTNGAGLVFRYQDPRNYWSVVALPTYATYAVTKTVAGREKTVATTGVSPTSDGVVVGVRLQGDTIDVVIDTEIRKTLTDGTLRKAQLTGMLASSGGAATARFDDLRLAGPRVPRPPPPTTTSTSPPPPPPPPSTTPPAAPTPTPPPTPPTTPSPPPPTTSPPTTAPPPARNRQPPTTPPTTQHLGPTIPLA